MSCNEYIIWISGHIDGTNPIKEEKMLQDHLEKCPHCRQLLEEMKANDAALKEELIPPERIHKNVMSAVRKDTAKKKSNRVRSYLVSIAATAAVMALVFVAALRMPEFAKKDIPTEAIATPTEAALPRSGEEVPVCEGNEISPVTEAGITEGTKGTKGTKTRGPQKSSPCHCVFVELPSQDAMPVEWTPMDTEDMLSRITREAVDHYFYGGSMIYGAMEMSYEEVQEWEDMIQFRFLQEFEETDSYIVVFCSESR